MWCKIVVPKNTFSLFLSECFLVEHLQPWIAYIQCIWQIFLFKKYCYFKGALASIHLSATIIISGGLLQWPSIFKGTVSLWNKHLAVIPFFKGIEFQLQPSIRQIAKWKNKCSQIFFQIYCIFVYYNFHSY